MTTPPSLPSVPHVSTPYVIYDGTTGRVIRHGMGLLKFVMAQLRAGEKALPVPGNDRDNYVDVSVDPPVIQTKTEMSYTQTGNHFTNLPIPCEVFFDYEKYIVEDGEIELDAEMPGTYPLQIKAVPYLTVALNVVIE